MKRSKIKPKYLNKQLLTQNNPSLADKLENKIIKSLVSLGLILLLLTWGAIPIIILSIFGVDYTTLKETNQNILMFINDILLIIFLFYLYKETIKQDFENFFNNNLKENFKIALHYWVIGMTIMIFSNYIISIVNNGKIAVNEESVQALIKTAPLYMAFELIIFAPITEELIFRKSIRDIIKNPYIYEMVKTFAFPYILCLSY